MEKPKLEEVKEYFKNAEIIESRLSALIVKNNGKFRKGFDGDFYLDSQEGIEVWSHEKGYAKILKYKKPEFRPIAMRCTQEQFDAIKPKLEKYGCEVSSMTSFENHSYLVNNGFAREKHVTNFGIYSVKFNGREIHETWDEKVFLEACGIEVKKEETFVITEGFLKAICQEIELNQSSAINWIKEKFPKAFKEEKKEVVLEVGKWYKRPHNKALFFIVENPLYEPFEVYGFDNRGNWMGINNRKDKKIQTVKDDELEATPQEVSEALEKEAVKRYKKGDFIIGLYNKMGGFLSFEPTVVCRGHIYVSEYFSVWMNIGNGRNEKVFDNGKWAEIIPTITIKEAEEKLNNEFKIVMNKKVVR